MENRRFLLAALLSAVVLLAWQYMIVTLRPPEDLQEIGAREEFPRDPDPTSEYSPSGAPAEPSQFEPAEVGTGSVESTPIESTLIDFPSDRVVASVESRTVLENDEIRAEFTNLGAQLVSLRVKESSGHDQELVRPRGSDPFPFSLVVGGEKSHPLNSALFEVYQETEEGLEVLRFVHRSERGAAEKVFGYTAEGLLDVRATVLGVRDWGMVFGPGVRQLGADEASSQFTQRMASYRRGTGESEEYLPEKVNEDILLSGSLLNWVSLEDSSFLSAVLPREGLREVLIRPVQQRAEILAGSPRFLPVSTQINEEGLSRELLFILQASGEQMSLQAFFGTKKYRRLADMPYHLEETVRWGDFIGHLARPLYFALEWIHSKIVANYGWAIVLVTILIRLVFLPLTYKSQESMTKMQELNPKIQAIKAKYQGKLKDKQGRPNLEIHRAMQEEQSALLREAGVNPAASCLPLLLQMPVFFAFFKLLSTAVELRDASWIGWVQDLSSPDPWYILPILMGVTSIAMQKMMPAGGDPFQRRIMQMMPIMFTFFALTFPSGLVLYWVTNNLLSMAQQWLMIKLKQRKAAAAA